MKFVLKIFFFFIFVSFLSLVGLFLLELDSAKKELNELIHYKPELTTRIYDANGELISNIFKEHHRLYVRFEDIPPRLIETLAATEDTLFFEHTGINFDAIFRALAKNLQSGRVVEGASTITQQLIKSTVLSPEKTLERKINEAILALRLETLLSKEEILERYLNHIYFGHGYYGVKTAALGYFKKELNELTLKEIAMLIALPRAPSFYDPTKNMQLNLSRANKILYRLNSLGWVDSQTLDRALKEVPVVYDESLSQNRAPYVTDEVIRRLEGSLPDLRHGGYDIFTTVDMAYQDIAKQSLEKGYEDALKRIKAQDRNSTKLNGAMVVLESQSGRIKALIGGVNYRESSFNRATQSQRQPGSSFKPFVYLAALNMGYSPYSEIADISRTFKYYKDGKLQLWKPQNYSKTLHGMVTIEEAVVKSINLATINIATDIGLPKLFNQLTEFGFEGLPENLSVALGSFGASPLEMAGYYTAISNMGYKVKPFLIEKIEKNGGEIYSAKLESMPALPPEESYLMVDILQKAVSGGTGTRARVEGVQVAGKTGTTNDYKDAWFCGFTPTLTTVAWFGNDDYKPMSHGMTGGAVSAPVFKYFFDEFLKIHPEIKREFDVPEGVKFVYIDGKRYLFTDISKLPKKSDTYIREDGENEIIF